MSATQSARFRLQQPVDPEKTRSARGKGEGLQPEPAKAIDLRVARRIRERRKRIGMTQQKLAQMIGVAFQQAHKYEHGLSRISAGRLFQIATVLGVPIVYFFLKDEEAAALELPGPPDKEEERDE
jgi:DNA-binding XRE family transcriptional regulator